MHKVDGLPSTDVHVDKNLCYYRKAVIASCCHKRKTVLR